MSVLDGLRDGWTKLVTIRRLVKALERMATAQEQQTLLLARLADRLAPVVPEPTEAELKQTGPTFSRDWEQARLAEWSDQFRARIGREPSEMEQAEYLDALAETPPRGA